MVNRSRGWVSSVLLAGAGLSLALVPASPAGASIPATLIAEYSFDTVSTATVTDLTGGGHLLTLSGQWSVTDGVASPAVAFAPVSLGTSPSKSDLNPGGREFAVSTVFKLPGDTAALPDTPNIVQKGYFSDPGQWKMQLKPDRAYIQCRFKGTLAAKLVSSSVVGIDDGAWHTATCWRSAKVVGVTVDGVTNQASVDVGDISSGRPLRVGAKSLSAPTDQFAGSLDYVAVAVGDGAAALSRSAAPSIP